MNVSYTYNMTWWTSTNHSYQNLPILYSYDHETSPRSTVEPHRQPWHFGPWLIQVKHLAGPRRFLINCRRFKCRKICDITWIPIHLKSEKPKEKTKVQKKWKGYEGLSDLSSFVGFPMASASHRIQRNLQTKVWCNITAPSGLRVLETPHGYCIFKAVNFTKTKYGISFLSI